jgi:hypothetical protein
MMTQMMNNNNNNHHNPPQQDRLSQFLRLNPPSFSSSSEPIAADDWLRTINKKLDTIEAQEDESVRFAAHQLEGPAAEWWDNYQITYPDMNAITWCRGDDLGGAPRASQYAGWRPRSPHEFRTRGDRLRPKGRLRQQPAGDSAGRAGAGR